VTKTKVYNVNITKKKTKKHNTNQEILYHCEKLLQLKKIYFEAYFKIHFCLMIFYQVTALQNIQKYLKNIIFQFYVI